MMNSLLVTFIRTRLYLTGHKAACTQIRQLRDNYLALAEGRQSGQLSRSQCVPSMPGVDEDMRRWSFYQTLEHNTIVNRSIAHTVSCLLRGEAVEGGPVQDAKRDVMPGPDAGAEQLEAFRASVDDYLAMVEPHLSLRGTAKYPHPLFGLYDAHMWHAMFGFHLKLHYKQAQMLVRSKN